MGVHTFSLSRHFNSTMVRLKELLQTYAITKKLFQFHYGTIKSPSITLWGTSVADFNSTMVRLKARNCAVRVTKDSIFQFHYGTIKRKRKRPIPKGIRYFNSTMVRLKEYKQVKIKNTFLFQFHYGTIKSLTLEKISVLIFKNLANTKL